MNVLLYFKTQQNKIIALTFKDLKKILILELTRKSLQSPNISFVF